MKPGKDKARKPSREEFGATARARQPGGARPTPRNLRRPVDFGDLMSSATGHGEDIGADREKPLPREDRAG